LWSYQLYALAIRYVYLCQFSSFSLTSTSIFGEDRISTHIDHTHGQHAGRIGLLTGPRLRACYAPSRYIYSLVHALADSPADFGLSGSKVPQNGRSLPWSLMNRRAKFAAVSFIVSGEIHNRTTTHTHTHTKLHVRSSLGTNLIGTLLLYVFPP